MVLYSLTFFLALFSAGLPAGLYSIIWNQMSEKLTLAVPYVSLLRAMIAAGAVIACILCGRQPEKKERNLDLCLAGVSLETLGVVGLSLSRVFWNLMVWSFVLGLGYGMSLTLICMAAVRLSGRSIMLQFSGASAGILSGAWILMSAEDASGSWRTGCQVLALVQVIIIGSVFLIRRALLKGGDVRKKLEERSREAARERERQRKLRHPDREDLEQAERQFMTKALFSCFAAFAGTLLVFCLVLWPQSFRVASTGADMEMTGLGVVMTGLGLAAGRIAAALCRPKRNRLQIGAMALMAVLLLLEQYLIAENGLTDMGLLIFQLLTGAAAGPVFPSLLLLDDVRLDREAEGDLLALLPAFALGSWIVITPLTQALVGGGQTEHFPVWLLLITVVTGFFLFLSSRGEKD